MIDKESISVIKKHTFPKEEKLCSEKCIDKLFMFGSSFIAYPLRIVFLSENKGSNPQSDISILISVPKRKFKSAVKRNKIKRLIREAYRLNKGEFSQLTEAHDLGIHIAILYLQTEIVSYDIIEKAMQKTVKILAEKINEV